MSTKHLILSTLSSLVLVLSGVSSPGFTRSELGVYLSDYGVDIDEASEARQFDIHSLENDPDLVVSYWAVPGVPEPGDEVWAGISDEDVAVWEVSLEAARQAAKPALQKAYENSYATLCEAILTLAEDSRAGGETPAILGLQEIQTLIENLPAEQELAGIRLTLKILAVDAALKRFDILWWDDVAWHPEVVE